MKKLTDFQRRKRLRERVAAWRAKKKAERLAAEVAAAQPVTPEVSESAGGLPVSESGQEAEPVAAKPASAKRYKYWLNEEGDRLTWVPDLAALETAYRQAYGEDLPDWAKTRKVGDEYPKNPVAERIVSIRQVVLEDRAGEELRKAHPEQFTSLALAAKFWGVPPEQIVWTDYAGRLIENPEEWRKSGRLLFSQALPNPATRPAHSEQARKQQLLDRLTGGLAALAGNPETGAF